MSSIIRNTDRNDFLPERFSTLLDRFFSDSVNNFSRLNSFVPSVDVSEDATKYEIHVAVPGMKKEDFKVELHEKTLTISGERKFTKEEGDKKTFHKVETQYGSFTRSFVLPDDVKLGQIEASYKDGLLVLVAHKDAEKKQSTQIVVN